MCIGKLWTACRVEARELRKVTLAVRRLKPWQDKVLGRTVDDWSYRGTKVYGETPRRYFICDCQRVCILHGPSSTSHLLSPPPNYIHTRRQKGEGTPNSALLMLYELQKSCKLQTMPMERRIALYQTPICPHLRLHLHAQKSLNS